MHGVHPVADLVGAVLAPLVLAAQLVVHVLEVAAVEVDEGGELFEGVAELLLRLVLAVARLLHAVHEHVALLDADPFERVEIGPLTAGEREREQDDEQRGGARHRRP